MEHGIVLPPEILGSFQNFPITNTLLVSWITMAVLIMVAFLATRRVQLIPSGLQGLFEMIVDFGYNTVSELAGDKKAKVFFPIVMTFFLFILFSNWIGLLPGMGTVGLREGHAIIPFIRSGSADLNTTLALSVIVVLSVQIIGIATIGMVKYGKKFFVSPFHKPYIVGSFVGILELLSEVTRMISFSFRLFGNVFAGEVLLIVMLNLMPYFLPVPFLIIEIFVGFVQAIVFALLALVFIKMATLEAEH